MAKKEDFYKKLIPLASKDLQTPAQQFKARMENIKTLWDRYNTAILPKASWFMLKMQETPMVIDKEGKEKEGPLSDTVAKGLSNHRTRIYAFITEVTKWLIASYREVMTLRKLLTKQQFAYHLLNDGKRLMFVEITEEQFFKLLDTSGYKANFAYGLTKASEKLTSAESYINNLKLKIDTRIDSLKKLHKEKDAPLMELSKDALYQYLSNDNLQHLIKIHQKYWKPTKEEEGEDAGPRLLSHSRRIELYDQMKSSLDWKTDSSGHVVYPKNPSESEYFFTKERLALVDRFYGGYIASDLHKDKTAYYKMGDAIGAQDPVTGTFTLIENKVTGGVLSFSTTKNIIRDLAKIQLTDSPEVISSKLQSLYAEYDSRTQFSINIQEAAYKQAVENIDKTIKEIFSIKK